MSGSCSHPLDHAWAVLSGQQPSSLAAQLAVVSRPAYLLWTCPLKTYHMFWGIPDRPPSDFHLVRLSLQDTHKPNANQQVAHMPQWSDFLMWEFFVGVYTSPCPHPHVFLTVLHSTPSIVYNLLRKPQLFYVICRIESVQK